MMSKILLRGFGLAYKNSLFECAYCGGTIEDGDIYVSRAKKLYHCITCAEILNMVTREEIKNSVERYEGVVFNKGVVIEKDIVIKISTPPKIIDAEDKFEFTLTPVDDETIAEVKAEVHKEEEHRLSRAEFNRRYRRRD